MKEPAKRRLRYVGLRFTREEFEKIDELKSKSTTKELSEFIRKCVFDKPITIRQRNASLDDFMQQMILLKNEFSAIGNNFNQAVRLLNTFKEYGQVEEFMQKFSLVETELKANADAIQDKINKIADEWLQ